MLKKTITYIDYNGTERKERLTAAGYDYAAIQHRVNELLS